MISNAPVRKPDYYSKDFMKDDYYNKSDKQSEGIGEWHGKGLEKLGLSGTVKQRDFWNVLKGLKPDGEEKLSKYVRKEPKDFGQDFVFNANKHFSIVLNTYPIGSKEWEHLESTWKKADDFARQEIEKRLTTREGKEYKPVKGAVCATWQHQTSREEGGKIDMQRHSHNVFANFALNEKGEWKAVDFKRAFEDKLLIASQFQEILAKGVQELGFELKEGKTGWEIIGLPTDAVEYYSGRSNKIKEKSGDDTSYQNRQSKANEKIKKGDYDLHELQTKWKKELDTRFGVTPSTLNLARNQPHEHKKQITQEEVIKRACQISKGVNFSEYNIDVAIAQKLQTKSFDSQAMKQSIMSRKDLTQTTFRDKLGKPLMFCSELTSKNFQKTMNLADKVNLQAKKTTALIKSIAPRQVNTQPSQSNSGQNATKTKPQAHQAHVGSSAQASANHDSEASINACHAQLTDIQNALANLDATDPDNLPQINQLRAQLENAKSQLVASINQKAQAELKAQMEASQTKQQPQLER